MKNTDLLIVALLIAIGILLYRVSQKVDAIAIPGGAVGQYPLLDKTETYQQMRMN